MNFYEAYHFLKKHSIFKGRFLEGLDILVVKVDPETEYIEDDKSRNTAVRVWLETGPCLEEKEYGCCWGYDFELDCGGKTFEEAIIKLAENVKKKYGDSQCEECVYAPRVLLY